MEPLLKANIWRLLQHPMLEKYIVEALNLLRFTINFFNLICIFDLQFFYNLCYLYVFMSCLSVDFLCRFMNWVLYMEFPWLMFGTSTRCHALEFSSLWIFQGTLVFFFIFPASLLFSILDIRNSRMHMDIRNLWILTFCQYIRNTILLFVFSSNWLNLDFLCVRRELILGGTWIVLESVDMCTGRGIISLPFILFVHSRFYVSFCFKTVFVNEDRPVLFTKTVIAHSDYFFLCYALL